MAIFIDNNGRSIDIKKPDIFYYALMLQNELNPTEERLKKISKDIQELKEGLKAVENNVKSILLNTSQLATIDSNINSIKSNVLSLIRQNNGMEAISALEKELTAYKNDFYHKLLQDKIFNTHIYVYRTLAYEGIQKSEADSSQYDKILNLIKEQLKSIGIETKESGSNTPFDPERMEVCKISNAFPASSPEEDGTVFSSVVPLFYWEGENDVKPSIISKEEVILYEYNEGNE